MVKDWSCAPGMDEAEESFISWLGGVQTNERTRAVARAIVKTWLVSPIARVATLQVSSLGGKTTFVARVGDWYLSAVNGERVSESGWTLWDRSDPWEQEIEDSGELADIGRAFAELWKVGRQ